MLWAHEISLDGLTYCLESHVRSFFCKVDLQNQAAKEINLKCFNEVAELLETADLAELQKIYNAYTPTAEQRYVCQLKKIDWQHIKRDETQTWRSSQADNSDKLYPFTKLAKTITK